MVNHVVPTDELTAYVDAMATRISAMPRLGLALTKKVINNAEDLQGMRAGMDSVFGYHHAAHAHNAEVTSDSLGGLDAKSMAAGNKAGCARNCCCKAGCRCNGHAIHNLDANSDVRIVLFIGHLL